MRFLPLTLALLACGGTAGDDSAATGAGTAATGPGTLTLSFGIEPDLIPGMATDPVGTFNGSIYRDEDASAIGPNDGATSVEDLDVALDLTNGDVADAATTGQLDPGIYWILGCLDVDANGCDKDDPITVPNENKFLVEPETDSPARVFFSLLNPS